PAVPRRILEGAEGVRNQGGHFPGSQPAHAPPLVRDAPARAWSGPADDPDDARACRSVDDANLHARARSTPACRVRPLSSAQVGPISPRNRTPELTSPRCVYTGTPSILEDRLWSARSGRSSKARP